MLVKESLRESPRKSRQGLLEVCIGVLSSFYTCLVVSLLAQVNSDALQKTEDSC